MRLNYRLANFNDSIILQYISKDVLGNDVGAFEIVFFQSDGSFNNNKSNPYYISVTLYQIAIDMNNPFECPSKVEINTISKFTRQEIIKDLMVNHNAKMIDEDQYGLNDYIAVLKTARRSVARSVELLD